MKLAAIDPARFRSALTLPEFVGVTTRVGPPAGVTFGAWVSSLTSERTAMAYLREPIGEVDDPTGTTGRTFERAVVELEATCSVVAAALAQAIGARTR